MKRSVIEMLRILQYHRESFLVVIFHKIQNAFVVAGAAVGGGSKPRGQEVKQLLQEIQQLFKEFK